MSIFRSEISSRRLGTWIAIGFTLLCVTALATSTLFEGRTGLALKGWGLLLVPIAAAAIILNIGPFRIIRNMRRMLAFKGRASRPKTVKIDRATLTPEDCQDDANQSDFPNPCDNLAAHFNGVTGEVDAVRGLNGEYDPPYSLTKG